MSDEQVTAARSSDRSGGDYGPPLATYRAAGVAGAFGYDIDAALEDLDGP